MRELHLFAGAGGGILGGILCGHTCVCAVEIETYRRQLLHQRQRDGILPHFPIWDDIQTFDGRPWRGFVDIICGGFPCQDISAAGKGKGITGARSGLWSEFSRLIGEVQPKFALVENSPMLAIRGLGRVLGDLAELGYDARWGMFQARTVGAIHKRERIFILASNALQVGWKWIRPMQSEKKQTREQFERHLESELRMAVPAGTRNRVADDVAYRMDRLAAIGDGQVPSVVRLAWQTLAGPPR